MEEILLQLRSWMDANPREVAVLYFGSIEEEATAYPLLREALRRVFSVGSVGLNTRYKKTGVWPTLGQAVDHNKRVFVFARTDLVDENDDEVMKEIQVEAGDQGKAVGSKAGEATILSTFKSG